MSAKHVYLIDGSGYIFRGYHALPPLTNPEGTPIGAVLGFCNILLKLLEHHEIDYLGVVFDTARENFRHQIYPDYKANRTEPPEDLKPQFQIVRDACEAFNVPVIEQAGFEADDIIATLTDAAKREGATVTIVSSDKDLMQLIGDGVTMLDPIKYRTLGYEDVIKKFGVGPEGVVDVQALAGDSSDNVPGVAGIGVKTAAQLITDYGSLEALLEQAQAIKQPKRRQTLIDTADLARISKQLVSLKRDVPLEAPLEAFALSPPRSPDLLAFLQVHGFKNLIGRFLKKGIILQEDLEAPPESSFAGETVTDTLAVSLRDVTSHYHRVTSLAMVAELMEQARDQGYMAFDTETTSLDVKTAQLVGFSLALKPGEAYYCPLGHAGDADNLNCDDVLALLKGYLTDPSLKVIGHNIKYDMHVMFTYDIEIACIDDTMVMAYALLGTTERLGLDPLVWRYFSHRMIPYTETVAELQKNATFADVPLETAVTYASEDADYTLRLYHLLSAALRAENAAALYQEIDRPLIKILASMEHYGALVDRDYLAGLKQSFSTEIQKLEHEIFKHAGRTFTIGSPKQLAEILFEDLSLEAGKKGKSGVSSTRADILEQLAAEGHTVPQLVLQWRQLSKLLSTYCDGMEKHIQPHTGRVHTTYGQTTTATGRLSSSDPNLQNIPIRTEEGRRIRGAFIVPDNFQLVSLDYSQIELRLLAHLAGVKNLITAFKNNEDIHKDTAARVFACPIDGVTPEQRRAAKAVNFGIIYGISPYGLARQLGVGQQEAKHIIEAYFQSYPEIKEFMEAQKAFARKYGYVSTLYDRPIFVPGINDKNFARRGHAERQAINAPLQATQAEIIKIAMARLLPVLREFNDEARDPPSVLWPACTAQLRSIIAGPKVRMVLQVHDELVFECRRDLCALFIDQAQKVMASVVGLRVPLVVDAAQGLNWRET